MMPTRSEILAFSDMIQKRAQATGDSLWDTLVQYCDEHEMENVVAASLLTKTLREEIRVEVQELNLLRGSAKKGAKLPI
jgi:hypothetical protein